MEAFLSIANHRQLTLCLLNWFQILEVPLNLKPEISWRSNLGTVMSSDVTLGSGLNLSKPHFPYLQNRQGSEDESCLGSYIQTQH